MSRCDILDDFRGTTALLACYFDVLYKVEIIAKIHKLETESLDLIKKSDNTRP